MGDIMYEKPKIISEIGCNHMGNLDLAKELIDLSVTAGADVAKFQKRDNRLLLTQEQYDAVHPVRENSYGETYGEHREFLEFNKEQHRELQKYCLAKGISYSTSVWEASSAEMITDLNPEFIKVPSACNNNFDMLELLRDKYSGEVQISFGMTTHAEEKKIIELFEEGGHAKSRLIIYACTSGYPVPFRDVCLLEISRLRDTFGKRVKGVGFSGHHLGIAVDVAAYTLGAEWIERHFTKDRTLKGTDHAASLEFDGLKKLVRNLNATYEALNFKHSEILEIEAVQRSKLKNRK